MNYLYLALSVFLLVQCDTKKPGPAIEKEKVYSVVEEVRIGTSQEENYLFSSISKIAPREDDFVFIGDGQIPIIRLFDSEGKFVKQVGRKGRGPGEYLRIGGIDMSNNQMLVFDQSNSRVNFYTKEGVFIKSVIVSASIYAEKVFQSGINESFYVKKSIHNYEKRKLQAMYWIKYDKNGVLQDSIAIPRRSWQDKPSYVVFTESGNAYPFVKDSISAISPFGYLVFGDNSEYKIRFTNNKGEEIILSRELVRVRILEDEEKQWDISTRGYGVNLTLPEEKPYFKNIKIDSDGRIWVWRYVEAENIYLSNNQGIDGKGWWEKPTFDVFLANGKFYGTVKLPYHASFIDAIGNKVWAATENHTQLIRFRME